MPQAWGWAGPVQRFLSLPAETWLAALERHHEQLWGFGAAAPHVKRAFAAGVPETIELLGRLTEDASVAGGRVLAFVTGVPGAGRTLVGLRLVYERTAATGRATFLSGNGPLVQVLQDALQSRAFVRDLHAFIRTYAINQRKGPPAEHVIVFDEAQRAWDERYMHNKRGVPASEPELLLDVGQRIPGWSALVGLVGHGQQGGRCRHSHHGQPDLGAARVVS